MQRRRSVGNSWLVSWSRVQQQKKQQRKELLQTLVFLILLQQAAETYTPPVIHLLKCPGSWR